MPYQFRNLVFEGGGVKGIAYVGALGVLEQKGILKNIKRVGGTSAGAIIALLIGLGYSLSEIENILTTLNFKNFLDDSWGILRDAERIVHEYGLYKGDFFLHWAEEKVGEKTGDPEATFGEIANRGGFRDMYFMGVNLSTGYAEVFSAEKTPAVSLAYAVRISMSIPLFFAAIKVPSQGEVQRVYVDGGVIDNYPIKLFDRMKYLDPNIKQNYRETDYYKEHNQELVKAGKVISPYVFNKETLGFRLDTATEIGVFRDDKEPPKRQINNLVDYAQALWAGLTGVQQSMHLHSDDWQRSIYIDTLGVGTTDFNLSDETKKALKQSGQKGADEYFKWYDDPRNGAVNRPDVNDIAT